LRNSNKSSTIFPVQVRHLRKRVLLSPRRACFFTEKSKQWEWIMSEKKGAGVNGIDTQAKLMAWIVANNGCKDVSCLGRGGVFNDVICPLGMGRGDRSTSCSDMDSPVIAAKVWIEKYHQRKAETAHIERITQLEKENADLKAQIKRLNEACETGSCGFGSLRRDNTDLQSANALLREEIDAAIKAENYTHRQRYEEDKRILQRFKELERQLRERDQWAPHRQLCNLASKYPRFSCDLTWR
jgi:uncharacterized protein (UPF0335 family)